VLLNSSYGGAVFFIKHHCMAVALQASYGSTMVAGRSLVPMAEKAYFLNYKDKKKGYCNPIQPN